MPIIVGETAFAIRLSHALLDQGVFVTGFGFPVVPEGTARIRVQMSAALTEQRASTARWMRSSPSAGQKASWSLADRARELPPGNSTTAHPLPSG